MAAFTPANPIGWAAGDPVTSAQMNKLDQDHVKSPNWVDGGATYNPAAQLVMGGAGMRWNGPTLFSGTSVTTFANGSDCVWQDGSSSDWQDGSSVTFGDGCLVTVELDCTIELFGGINVRSGGGIINVSSGGVLDFDAGSSLSGSPTLPSGTTLTAASGSTIAAASGSTITAASGSTTNLNGTTSVDGVQPASTADPGVDNRLCGVNLVKAWAAVQFTGGAATVLDGYNVASVSFADSGATAVVTLARAMANANYAVTYGVGGSAHQRKYATTQDGSTTTVFQFNVWDELAASQLDLDGATNIIVSFCVMGRQ